MAEQNFISISVDDVKVAKRVEKILKGVKNLTPLHKRLGIRAHSYVMRTFDVGGRPKKWAALKEATILRRRKESSLPLQDEGLLRQSFASEATASAALMGSQLGYSIFHDKGTKHIPQRRILPTIKEAEDEFATKIVEDYANEIGGK